MDSKKQYSQDHCSIKINTFFTAFNNALPYISYFIADVVTYMTTNRFWSQYNSSHFWIFCTPLFVTMHKAAESWIRML